MSYLDRGSMYLAVVILAGSSLLHMPAAAQTPRIIDLEFYPTRRAQIAVWIERADGTYLRTLRLTQATATRGIGNRPGASQMNSGFRWPYGRREGVLPVWAHRRASAPGAEMFRRVIFQDRISEGHASRSSSDFSRDDYFCLSFSQASSQRDALDAVTCPSQFNSDKGRYVTENDVSGSYAEPTEASPGASEMRALSLNSYYPPRRDAIPCTNSGCFDHGDVASFGSDAVGVMPELDVVSMATLPEAVLARVQFTFPEDWEDGDYALWIEVNTEGDYNEEWGPSSYPTPVDTAYWDHWARSFGYPYRGQPSVAYRLDFSVGGAGQQVEVRDPIGHGSLSGYGENAGEIVGMDDGIANDPVNARGSGADRLLLGDRSWRARVTVLGEEVCASNTPPNAVQSLEVMPFEEQRHQHRFAQLSFRASDDDQGVDRYDVRFSREPIVDEESFVRAMPAQAATLEIEALQVPIGQEPGSLVDVDIGGLTPETDYYIAVRAMDRCNAAGEIQTVRFTTPAIHFTTVSPCFVATAAYGTPMADEIHTLRRFRDRYLRSNAAGRALVQAYHEVGPHMAAVIRENTSLRSAARTLLRPIVSLAQRL